MITTTLINLLLCLCILWLGIISMLSLNLLFRTHKRGDKTSKEEPILKDRKEKEEHILIVPSRPTISPDFPVVPHASSPEERAEEAPTFAAGTTDAATSGIHDEDKANPEILIEDELIEVDETEILREELLLASELIPEVSSSDVLARDLTRLTAWTKQSEFDEDEQEMIADTAAKLHGSELMAQYLAHLKSEEQKHFALLEQLTALDDDEDVNEPSTPSDSTAADNLPLEYYL
jgi:hypothetical protein